ncbi:MAG: response regulator, partial [Bacteroides sp.]|nr:response regulator [Bacteroides sp.]
MIIRILLVDDHPLFRAGIRGILDLHDDIRVEGEATNGIEALKLVNEIVPDLVIMDISMPQMDGIETTKRILDEHPHIKVLALSIHAGKRFVKQMLDAGAAGYLLKDSAPDELITAIRKMAKGDMYLSSAITSIALNETHASKENDAPLMLNTRLYRPRISDDQIPRHDIINQLEKNLGKTLTLVAAPAGYGKSIVVSQWVESSSALHSWISIDDTFNDLNTFLTYFHAALDKISPGSWNKTENLIHASDLPPLEVISNTLINELNQIQQPYILVMDDYHLIHNMEIHRLINEVLRFPPKYMHLCIITRRDPPIDLLNLRTHQGLNEIRMQELAFSENEVRMLMQIRLDIDLSEENSLLLQEKTEGWIVGIRLALYAMKSSEDGTRIISKLKGNFHAISEFLLEEMLESQTPEVQELMLRTSLLDEFCIPLIEKVFVEQSEENFSFSIKEFIQILIQSNLFVVNLDLENHWFRYHHLVQDFLYIQLKKRYDEKELTAFHLLASKWYEANKMLDEAIQHSIVAGDTKRAAEIIGKHRLAIQETDNWVRLKKWLSLLPEELIESRPELLMAQIWVYFAQLDFQNIFDCLEKVQKIKTKQKVALSIKGEINFFKGIISYFTGQATESLAYLQEAIKLIPDSYPQLRGEADLILSLSMHLNGNKKGALEYLDKLLMRSISMKATRSTKLWAGKAYIQLLEAQLQEALPCSQNLQRIGEKDKTVYPETWGIYIEAIVHFNRKDWVKAKIHLDLLLSKLYILHVNIAADAFCMLAYILQSNKKLDESKSIFKQLDSYIEPMANPVLQNIASSARARMSLIEGDIDGAIQWAQLDDVNTDAGFMLWWVETPRLTGSRIYIAEGSPAFIAKALEKLKTYNQENIAIHNHYQRIEILAQMAMCYFKLDRLTEAYEVLEESVTLGEPGRWIWPFCHFGPPMTKMLEHLMEKNIAPNYIRNILAQTA